MADDLIEKYLGANSVLPEQNRTEFLEGLIKSVDSSGGVPRSLVKRIIHAYRSGQDFR